MNKRHVRAIAVAAVAVVALTGARGSGGGGCDNNSSGSSGSSGSSNHNDSDSSGSSSGGSLPGGSSSADKAIRDVTIDECKYDQATKNLVARVTVKNDGSMDYDYNVTMKFKGAAGGSVVPRTAIKAGIAVAAGASQSAEVTTPYIGTGDGSEYTDCEVSRVSRF
ncbi:MULTISPECIES: hypothetical protein [Streptomyces]|uniref:Uncharacterized protein n=1 Tax=Streptomyces venezuelae TaxID=54571 RepID=A0A5P2AMB2_STRVZ|nr:hypothetical protein [Streptomyces venezuelae]QES19195.1 hypothetical protein DEJ46_08935 [Streptomyces venezuelae]